MSMPFKIANTLFVNITIYFMTNLRRDPGAFWFFMLIGFTMLMTMSMFFRLFASMTKTIAQALAPASLILMLLILYTGFVIPVQYMRGYVYQVNQMNTANPCRWISWIRHINPIAYGFDALMTNEFHGREFECASFVPAGPSYENISANERACAVLGSVPGANTISGTAFLKTAYGYEFGNRWRNFGIIVAMTIFLGAIQLIMTEAVASARSKGEVLVFQRSKMHKALKKRHQADEESAGNATVVAEKRASKMHDIHQVEQQDAVFHWEDVSYDIEVKKGETRRLLDSVDGWIKPGTLTALMVGFSKFPPSLRLTIALRVSPEPEKRPYSTCSLAENRRESLLVACWWTDSSATNHFNGRLAM
jgi:ATP-binding cassette, subfamily G (WHITE), member 2, PDR